MGALSGQMAGAALLMGLAGTCAAATPTSAQASTPQVRVRLLASHTSAPAGGRVWLGLEQRLAPHWHTYWLNPGDSGQATTIRWSLPEGAQAGPILWPTPRRIDVGPITNHGYDNQALLLTELTLPAQARPGQRLTVQADVNWLVCREECIPQEATLSLDVTVSAPGPGMPSAHARQLDRAHRALPQAAPWPVQVVGGQPLLLRWPVEAGTAAHAGDASTASMSAQFFPEQWGHVRHSATPRLERLDGVWQLALPVGEAPAQPGDAVAGLLVLRRTGTPDDVLGAWRVSSTAQAPGPSAAPTATIPAAPAKTDSARNPMPPPASADDALTLWAALGLALAGGVVLNLMPCVFPVLSIKVLSLLQHASGQVAVARRHGLVYAAGVLASFGLLALVLVVLKALGTEVGWGFQFQSPWFVVVVADVVFALGLALSGVLVLGAGLAGVGSDLAQRSG